MIFTIFLEFGNIRSPAVICLVGSKMALEWGARFESLRSPEKAVRNTALKTTPMYEDSHNLTNLSIVSISIKLRLGTARDLYDRNIICQHVHRSMLLCQPFQKKTREIYNQH